MIAKSVMIGCNVLIPQPELVNAYGCSIADGTKVGPFVEIQRDVQVGRNCKISSHSFLCSGVTLEDSVFIGHGVMFTNDVYPRATREDGDLQTEADWELMPILVRQGASIGSNASILPGVTVGRSAIVGAGSVVTSDVPDFAIVAGVPARVIGDVREREVQERAG